MSVLLQVNIAQLRPERWRALASYFELAPYKEKFHVLDCMMSYSIACISLKNHCTLYTAMNSLYLKGH